MRFSLVLGLFAAAVSAQSAATDANAIPSASATTTYSMDPAQASTNACLKACTPGDVSCESKCIAVPNPDAAQANATTDCVAACPVGNGTETDIENYTTCVADCISNNFYSTSGTPEKTAMATTMTSRPAATESVASGSSSSSSSSNIGNIGNTGSTGSTGSTGGTGSTDSIGSATSKSSATASSSSSAASETISSAAGAVQFGSSAAGLLGFVAMLVML